MYKARIRQLEELYNNLNVKISSAESADPVDSARVTELKNQRQTVLNELTTLRRAQWDYDHETIHMDDDR